MNLILPFPVSVNSMLGGGSGQKRFKSKAYKEWLVKAEEWFYFKNQRELPPNSPVHIKYYYYMPDNRARDLSNYIKVCEDFIVSKGIIEDDNCKIITGFSAWFCGVDKVNPRVEINVSAINLV